MLYRRPSPPSPAGPRGGDLEPREGGLQGLSQVLGRVGRKGRGRRTCRGPLGCVARLGDPPTHPELGSVRDPGHTEGLLRSVSGAQVTLLLTSVEHR